MFAEIIESIIDRKLRRNDAVLRDFARLRVRNARFPGIVKKEGSEIKGRIYFGLSAADLEKLDAYEGDLYERVTVFVTTSEGDHYEAHTFKVRDDRSHMLTDEEWDMEEFRAKNMTQFLRDYRGMDSFA